MNATIRRILQFIAIIAFSGLLASIMVDGDRRFELVCCAVATLCSYLVFFSKK